MNSHRVAVVGGYHTPVQGPVSHLKLEELVFDAAQGALADAGITIDDVDAIVIATDDQVHGRVIESMVTAGAVGAVHGDLTTVASAGEHALVYGYLRLLAGHSRKVLCMAWGKPSESKNPQHAEIVSAEPFLLRPYGMVNSVAAGLQASAYAARFGIDDATVARVRDLRRRSAESTHGWSPDIAQSPDRLVAWPLTEADLPVSCDVAAGVVLMTTDAVNDDHRCAWIDGVGWSTSAYDLAARDLSQFQSLSDAAASAWGADEDRTADVVEMVEISTVGGFAAYESLGFAPPGGGSVIADAGETVNPSGGNLTAHPGNAAGFMRLLAAAQQIRGVAGATQIQPVPKSAVGATVHGYAGQGAVVMRFGAGEEAVHA